MTLTVDERTLIGTVMSLVGTAKNCGILFCIASVLLWMSVSQVVSAQCHSLPPPLT